MRKPLLDSDPRWLSTSTARYGMGICFDCPHEYHPPGCRVSAWFYCPLDAGDPREDVPRLYDRDGEDFGVLSIWGPILHLDIHVIVYEGAVNVMLL